jgi:hypothetical protein
MIAIKTFTGKSGRTYLVVHTKDGDFHTFGETPAKEAALDCGAPDDATRAMWRTLWNPLRTSNQGEQK